MPAPRTCARCARFGCFAARWPDGHVCRTCSWNHLVASFVMGTKGESAPRSRRRAVK